MSFDDDDRCAQLVDGKRLDDAAEPLDHLSVGKLTSAEQDQSRSFGACKCQQPRVVQIRGDDDAIVCSRTSDDLTVGCALEADGGRVHRIVSLLG